LPNAADYDAVELTRAGLGPVKPDMLPVTHAIAPRQFSQYGARRARLDTCGGFSATVADFVEGAV